MKWLREMGRIVGNAKKMTVGFLAGTAAVNTLPSSQAKAATSEHPNIVFILVDDLGWTDINCRQVNDNLEYVTDQSGNQVNPTSAEQYDSPFYKTPNIARLREQSMRFTNAHTACPFCKATRVSIMTGKYPIRAGLPDNDPISNGKMLSLAETTIAEALDNHGVDYNSAFIGKWHLTTKNAKPFSVTYNPEKQGFELNIAGSWRACPIYQNLHNSSFWWGGDGYVSTLGLNIDLNDPNIPNEADEYSGYGLPPGLLSKHAKFIGNDTYDPNEDEYLTDRLTWEAVEFINNAHSQGRPFFLFLSHYGVHTPLQAKRQLFDNYNTGDYHTPLAHWRFDQRAVSDGGWNLAFNSTNWIRYSEHEYDGTFKYPNGNSFPTIMPSAGIFNECIDFSGDLYFEVDGGSSSNKADYAFQGIEGSGSRTCSFWMRKRNNNENELSGPIIGWGTDNNKWVISVESNEIKVDTGSGNISTTGALLTSPGENDYWHHVAVVYNGTEIEIYVDGTQNISQAVAVNTVLDDNVRIGKWDTSYFKGQLDEVSIYNTSLTGTEIARLADPSYPPHNNGTYAAMIESVDESVGEIRKALDDPDGDGNTSDSISNNTIIIFYSDNGAEPVSSNFPLRNYKTTMFEGGLRVPLLIYWPGVTTEKDVQDLVSNVPVSSIDILPTIVQMAYPDVDPDRHYILDGKSLCGLLKGTTNDIPRKDNALFFSSESWDFVSYFEKLSVLGTGYNESIDGNTYDSYDYKYITGTGLYKIHETNNEDGKVLVKNPEDSCNAESSIIQAMSNKIMAWEQKLKVQAGNASYNTINAAITALTSGGTIVLPCRSFHENISVNIGSNTNLTIESEDPDDPKTVASTIIDGSYLGSVIAINSGTVTIEGVTITNGHAANGGGVNVTGGTVTLSKCRIIGNVANNYGGGVYGSNVKLLNCTIENNTAGINGGGVYGIDGGGQITNCVIANNIAQNGGGISSCSGTIRNCTIVYNYAIGNGGGAYSCTLTSPNVFKNCIVWGNMPNQLSTECTTPTDSHIQGDPLFICSPKAVAVSEYGTLPENIINSASSFSAFAWVRFDNNYDNPNNQGILQQANDSQQRVGRTWLYRTGNKLGCYFGGGPLESTQTPFAITGQWHHIGITYDSQIHKVTMYVDGTFSCSVYRTAEECTGPFYIGRQKTGNYWDGVIDDVRIYNRILSNVEINDLYNHKSVSDNLIAHWNFNRDLSVINLQNTDNFDPNDIIEYDNDGIKRWVQVVGTNWIQIVPALTYPAEPGKLITNWGPVSNCPDVIKEDYHLCPNSPCIDAGDSTDIELNEKDIDGESRIIDSTGIPGVLVDIGADEYNRLIGHWKLDGNAEDASLNRYHGTICGNPVWGDGMVGQAVVLDGVDDYIQITGYKGIPGTASRTCSAWIKAEDDGSILLRSIVSWGEGSPGATWNFCISNDTNNGVYGALRLAAYNAYVIGSTPVNDNIWHHVAVVFENDGTPKVSDIRLYVDGKREIISKAVPAVLNTACADDVKIGLNGTAWYYKGAIDDVRIYDRALTDQEIEEMVLLGYWKLDGNADDASVYQHDNCFIQNPDWINGYINQSVDLNGTNYIDLDDTMKLNPATTSFSAFAWVRLDVKNPSVSQGILQQLGDDANNMGRTWLYRTTDDRLGCYLGGSPLESDQKPFDIAQQWHHVGITYNRLTNAATLYVDGIYANSATRNAEACTKPFYVGRQKTGNYWDGAIDDVRIYGRVLSAQEVKELAGDVMVGYWTLDNSADDSTPNAYDGTLCNFPTDGSQWQTGNVNGALVFDGQDYVSLPHIINPAATSFSAFAWVRLDVKNPSVSQGILQQLGDDANNMGRTWLYRTTDDRLGCYLGGSPLESEQIIPFDITQQWHHVGVTYNKLTNTASLYVDGICANSATRNAEACMEPFYLGRQKSGNYWNGAIDDVRIYGRVLTASEINVLAGQ
ncbi:LamG-like jellyroll fold domain-containing protein [Anaerohalosphaeraceae bacterium U12dextr]